MGLKKPLSFQQQVDRLIEHNMIVESKRDAMDFLSAVNYYRLTGYALQFRDQNGQDYVDGTSFNTVKNIYRFDEEMRGILRNALDVVEARYRTLIANGFALVKCIDEPYDGHYVSSNFYNQEMHQDVLASCLKEESRRGDSLVVQHHKSKYNDRLPLWVMVELLSFSSLSSLYCAMYSSEQWTIAKSCNNTPDALRNHLHVLSVLRNKCCHGGRLYNTPLRPPINLRTSYLKAHPEVRCDTLFAAILVIFRTLPTRESKVALYNALCNCITRYNTSIDLNRIGFPQNYQQLLQYEMNSR